MSDTSNFLKRSAGEQHPAFKFTNVGDTIVGVIAEEPRIVSVPNMNTGAPEDKLVIAITVDAGQTFAVWVKAGFLAKAIHEACGKVGTDGVAEGGRLAIRFTGTRDTGKPQPAKIYAAEYQPPSPVAVGGSLLAGSAESPETTPVAQPDLNSIL